MFFRVPSISSVLCTLCLLLAGTTDISTAQERSSSGLKVPRFVSIIFDKANMRVGPGTRFPVKWQYQRAGLPLEVIGEYNDWREVRDSEGESGWMHKRLLTGARYGLTKSSEPGIPIRRTAEDDGYILVFLRNNVVVRINQCLDKWCDVSTVNFEGWMQRSHLWGVYLDEDFE